MASNLSLFYKFYQTCEFSQCIDLSKDLEKYLLPINHGEAEKINEAAQDLDNRIRTKVTHFERGLFMINEAPNWLIRGERNCTSFSYIQDAPMGPGSSKILRVVMNHILKREVQDKKLDVIIPAEYLVNAPEPTRRINRKINYKDFFVASQKLDILNYQDTISKLKLFEQKKQSEVATTICRLIYHTGFMDAHMSNIVLTTDRRIAIVDTEGHSLLHDVTENYLPIALSDARIVGLKEFIYRSKQSGLPDVFSQTAKKYLFYARVMKVVKQATILFSIICPIIPLAVLTCSVASSKLHDFLHSNLLNEQLPFQPAI
ncbi:MAG: hypothetical protein LW832_03045 [Parachlamydia sp.]|jgi:hypothetical protein|nr:hypothetical protein [Parachlamydia sp.]